MGHLSGSYRESSGAQAIFISNMTVLVPNAVGTLLGSSVAFKVYGLGVRAWTKGLRVY